MTVLQLLRHALSRGRAATRSILKPIRPFKNTSRDHASVTTLSNTIPASFNLVLANGTINSTQYTAENTVRSAIETAQDTPSSLPTLNPKSILILGSTNAPGAPLLPPALLPFCRSSPVSVTIPAIPNANFSINDLTPHTDEEEQAQLSQRVPSTPPVYLRSLAPSPDHPIPGAQQLASPPTLSTPTVSTSSQAPPASALPIPFAQLPTIQVPPLPARDLVRSYMSLSHLTSRIRFAYPVTDLVTALLQLTPSDLIGASVQQPEGDRYTLMRCLGCGAMGWVMEARTHEGRTVAVKMQNRARMLGAMRTQVDQEARVMAKITLQAQAGLAQTRMPCLAGSLASWTDLCFDYLVMDMYPQNLLEWIYSCADHEFPFILAAAEMLAGLNRLHRMGFIHCDVKHENFLVSSAGHVVLADFGLAEPMRQALSLFENGTYGYMAPEVMFPGLFGDGVIDTRIDVWSLGLVFLEMYVRVQDPLYSGEASELVKLSVATRDPLMMDTMRGLKTHNPVLYDLLSKMLVRDPRYRWPTDTLMQHEFFKDVQWNSLEQWAKANDFITTTPPSPTGEGLTPSEYRQRAGTVVGINQAAIKRIAKHISAENPENYFWFNAKVQGIA